MDTTTVLEIIKMISGRLFNLQCDYEEGKITDQEYYARRSELTNLNTHLQSFIEGELSATENSTSE